MKKQLLVLHALLMASLLSFGALPQTDEVQDSSVEAGRIRWFSKVMMVARNGAKQDSAQWYVEQHRRYVEREMPNCAFCKGAQAYLPVYVAYYSGEMEVVIRVGEEALLVTEELLQTTWSIDILKYMGYAYKNKGETAMASKTFFRALDLTEQKGDLRRKKGEILLSLAELNRLNDKLDVALQYAQEAFELFQSESSYYLQYKSINEIANISSDLGKYGEALKWYRELLQPKYLRSSAYSEDRIYNNLGRQYSLMGQVDSADFYLNKALALHQRKKLSPASRSFPLNELMTLYKRDQQYEKAMRYAQQLLPMVDSISNIYQQRNIYFQYAQILAGLKDYKGAYDAQQIYRSLQDSIHRKEEREIVANLETQYETKAKEDKITLLNKEKELASFQRNVLIALSLMLLLLAIIIFRTWMRKKNREQQQLQAKTQQLQELATLKSTFFANITHELRTPLTLLLSPINALLKGQYGQLSTSTNNVLHLIQRNGQQLKRQIDEILDLSKLESRKLPIEAQALHLNTFLRQLIDAFQPTATLRKIDLQLTSEIEEDLWIETDEEKFASILNNLLSNAFKFTSENGRIELRAITKETEIAIEVTDNGRGISPEDLPHIFDRYYQSINVDQPKVGGAGIGLALAKAYAKALGGDLKASSDLGKFTELALSLPLRIAEAPLTTSPSITPLQPLPFVLQTKHKIGPKQRLLIVEDHPDMQNYLQSLLRDQYELLTATNGKAALEELSANPLPDLIISDVMMPEMDGFELLKQLKSEAVFHTIPTIMLTARVAEADKLEALRIGVDDYLTKPFSHEELLVRIQNVLTNLAARKTTPNGSPTPQPLNTQEWLQKVEQILLREISNKQYTMSSLADELNISQSKLARQVKIKTGLTPNKYFLEIRLFKAKKHLEALDFQTVAEVSYAIGFEDPNYFSKTYQQRYGKRPSSYLK